MKENGFSEKRLRKGAKRSLTVLLSAAMVLSGTGLGNLQQASADEPEAKKSITLHREEVIYEANGTKPLDPTDPNSTLLQINFEEASSVYDKNTAITKEMGNASGQQSDVLYMDFGSKVVLDYSSEVPFETYFSTSDGQYRSGYTSEYTASSNDNTNKVLIVTSEAGGSTLCYSKSGGDNGEYIGDRNIYYNIIPTPGSEGKSGKLEICTRPAYAQNSQYDAYIHFYGGGGKLDYTLNLAVMSRTGSYVLEETTLDVRQGRNVTINVEHAAGTDGYNWFILKDSSYDPAYVIANTDLKRSAYGIVSDDRKVRPEEDETVLPKGTISPRVVGGVTKADSTPGTFNAYSDRGTGDVYILAETNSGIDITSETNQNVALLGRRLQCITRVGVTEWKKAKAISFLKDGNEIDDESVQYRFMINSVVRLDNLVVGHTQLYNDAGAEIDTNDYFHFEVDGKKVNYKNYNDHVAEYTFSQPGRHTLKVTAEDKSVSKECVVEVSKPTTTLIAYANEIKDANMVAHSERTGESAASATLRYNNTFDLIIAEDSGANEPLKIRINNADSNELLSIGEPVKLADNIFKYPVRVIKDVSPSEKITLNINVSTVRDAVNNETPVNNKNVAFSLDVYPPSSSALKIDYEPTLNNYDLKEAISGGNPVTSIESDGSVDLYEGESMKVISYPSMIGTGAVDQIAYNLEKNAAFVIKEDSTIDTRATNIAWASGSGTDNAVLRANALSSEQIQTDGSGNNLYDENGEPVPVYRDKYYDGTDIPEQEREKPEFIKYDLYKDLLINTKIKTSTVTLALTGNTSANPTVNLDSVSELVATVTPADTNEKLYWKSVNSENIVFLDGETQKSELITDVTSGKSTVSIKAIGLTDDATIRNGAVIQVYSMHYHGNNVHVSSKVIATIAIKVRQAGSVIIAPDDWSMVQNQTTVKQLTAKVYETGQGSTSQIPNASCNWEIDDVDVVSFNDQATAEGATVNAKAGKVGKTKITATYGTGESTQRGYSYATITAPFTNTAVTVSGVESSYTYLPNGAARNIVPVVKSENIDSRAEGGGSIYTLINEEDYIYSNSYAEGKGVGSYAITLSPGVGGLYTGTRSISYTIDKKSIGDGTDPDAEISCNKTGTLVYNATEQVPTLDIQYTTTLDGVELVQDLVLNKDYTVKAVNVNGVKNVNQGTYTALVSAVANSNFTGSFVVEYTIEKYDLEANFGDRVMLKDTKGNLLTAGSIPTQTYAANPLTPTTTVVARLTDSATAWTTLTYKTPVSDPDTNDIKYQYENNTEAGTATVTITGQGNYKGEIETSFEIIPRDISLSNSGVVVDTIPAQTYTSYEIKPVLSVNYKNGTTVVEEMELDKDYTVNYSNNIDWTNGKSTATATITTVEGGNYSGTKTVNFMINQADLSDPAVVTIEDIPDQKDCGTLLTPPVTAKLGSYVMREGVDFTVIYGTGKANDNTYNLNPGEDAGVVTIVPVTSGNFKAGAKTTVAQVNGQEKFFTIKSISSYSDIEKAKEIRITTTALDGSQIPIDKIYVNKAGAEENAEVSVNVESLLDGDVPAADPVTVIADSGASKFYTYKLVNLNSAAEGNRSLLTIKGVAAGTYLLKLQTKKGLPRSIDVIVNEPATSVSIKGKIDSNAETVLSGGVQTALFENHNYTLSAAFNTATVTDSVEWSLSDKDSVSENDVASILPVGDDGRQCVVSTKTTGSFEVYAKTKAEEIELSDGSVFVLSKGGKKATAVFNVGENNLAQSVDIKQNNVSITSTRVKNGGTLTFTGTAAGTGGATVTEELLWSSSDDTVLALDSGQGTGTAKFKALKPGSVKVTYGSKLENGATKTIDVDVYVDVSAVELDSQAMVIDLNKSKDLKATFNEFASDQFVWTVTSKDKTVNPADILTLTGNNDEPANQQTVTLTGKKTGDVTVTVSAKSNGRITASCTVTVANSKATTASIAGTGQTQIGEDQVITINKGDTITLTGSASGEDGDVTEQLYWALDQNPFGIMEPTSRAMYNQPDIELKAYGAGDVNVSYGGVDARAFITVHIIEQATSLSFDSSALTLEEGKSANLTATFNGKAKGHLTWTVSNESVVKLEGRSEDEVNYNTVTVTALKNSSTATITVTCVENPALSATCTVKVDENKAETVTISQSSAELETGKTVTLTGTATRTSGTVTEQFEWKSSDESVAKILSGQGTATVVVAAVAPGTAIVTYAGRSAGGKSASCIVTVKAASQGSSQGGAGQQGGSGNTGDNGGSGNSGSQNTDQQNEAPKAGTTTEVKGSTYTVLDDSSVSYKAADSAAKKVKIPATIKIGTKTYKVTKIDKKAFANNKKLTSVTIGKNVTSIGDNAFKNCKALTKVVIPAGVTKIGKNAFAGCSKLKTVQFKTKELPQIGKKAFKTIKKGATFKCPKGKKEDYRKALEKSGMPKKAKVK